MSTIEEAAVGAMARFRAVVSQESRLALVHGRRGLRTLLAMAMPPVCCLCGASGQAPALDLCDVCTTFLPVVEDESGLALGIGSSTLLRTLFAFKYGWPVDQFIRALKFRGDRVYARVLGELIARAQLNSGAAMPACLVPMPLHASRYRERGFNQAAEIARYAGASLGVRVESRVLVRSLATQEQSALSLEERRRNVRQAFEVVKPLPHGRIALLDDVVTTGSTAMAAIQALADAGAKEIELWAAARAVKLM
jgi:ComF family protein